MPETSEKGLCLGIQVTFGNPRIWHVAPSSLYNAVREPMLLFALESMLLHGAARVTCNVFDLWVRRESVKLGYESFSGGAAGATFP